ncbi:MAG: metalloregulator ArsR/SmtB family transcription factor [Pseudomonadota bacterium]
MKPLDSQLGALADPTRRAIVELLVQQPYRASDLAQATGVTRSRMSKHLRVLMDAGIAMDERPADDARARVFHLQPRALSDVQQWLEQLQRQWDSQLQSFKVHVEERTSQSSNVDTSKQG